MMTSVFECQQNSCAICCDWPILGSVHLPVGYEEDMLGNSYHNSEKQFSY